MVLLIQKGTRQLVSWNARRHPLYNHDNANKSQKGYMFLSRENIHEIRQFW